MYRTSMYLGAEHSQARSQIITDAALPAVPVSREQVKFSLPQAVEVSETPHFERVNGKRADFTERLLHTIFPSCIAAAAAAVKWVPKGGLWDNSMILDFTLGQIEWYVLVQCHALPR